MSSTFVVGSDVGRAAAFETAVGGLGEPTDVQPRVAGLPAVHVERDPGFPAVAFGVLAEHPQVDARLAAPPVGIALAVEVDGGAAFVAAVGGFGVEAGVEAGLASEVVVVALEVDVDGGAGFVAVVVLVLDVAADIDTHLAAVAVGVDLGVDVDGGADLGAVSFGGLGVDAGVDTGLAALAAGVVPLAVEVDGGAAFVAAVGGFGVEAGVDTGLTTKPIAITLEIRVHRRAGLAPGRPVGRLRIPADIDTRLAAATATVVLQVDVRGGAAIAVVGRHTAVDTPLTAAAVDVSRHVEAPRQRPGVVGGRRFVRDSGACGAGVLHRPFPFPLAAGRVVALE
ncbi:MAG: hypothetical protein AAFZ07_19810 [Actinomycetota bacterium]